jgi:hypothetical protein
MSGLEYFRDFYHNYISGKDYSSNRETAIQKYSPISRIVRYAIPTIAATLCLGTALAAGDGSDEPGFVAPPKDRSAPPAPPRTISSAETTDPCCCCPVTPQARTEAKRPPQPPTLITKLKSE